MSINHDQRWLMRALFALQAVAVGCAPETVPASLPAYGALPPADPLGEIAFAEASAEEPVSDETPVAVRNLELEDVPPGAPAMPTTPTRPVQRSTSNTPAASAPTGTTASSANGTGAYSLPPNSGAFDYQIAGRYAADARVSVVSSNAALAGDQALDAARYNICYLNALQTQAEDYNYWLSNYPDLILSDAAGEPVHDPDPEWAGELLFDISTADKRTRLLELQRAWITSCRDAGFQAIEPDNIDSFSRAGGAFSAEEAALYMQQFVAEAHAQGLAVAQKNAAEWARDGNAASIGFDFAIIEECQLTGECDSVIAHYGAARVFEIEYVYDTDDQSSGVSVPAGSTAHFDQACAARGGNVRIVLRNRDVRASSAAGYVFQLCGDTSGTPPVMEPWPTSPAPGPERLPEDGEPPAPEEEPEGEPVPPGEPEEEPEQQDPWPEEEPEDQDPLPEEPEQQDPWPETDPEDEVPPPETEPEEEEPEQEEEEEEP